MIIAQVAVTVFIAVASLLISGTALAYSTLLGGFISALPNSYFAFHAYRYQGARNAHNVVKGFIHGELGKIIITVVLFALTFTLITSLNELALILGFIVAHFTGVVTSGFISYSPPGNNT
ncbi:MAG: ATP synthase subunit I [Gammaproteobacteria bacterium]|nr:ATP synthase subunit I [Gammaproteobacteria bacterium]